MVTDTNSRIQEINFLLLNPDNKLYIEKRINELQNKKVPLDYELSSQDIKHSIDIIESINTLGLKLKCDFAFFDEELKWNLVIFDNYILVGFYVSDIIATKGLSILVNRDSLLGNTFSKYYNDLWSRSLKSKNISKDSGIEK